MGRKSKPVDQDAARRLREAREQLDGRFESAAAAARAMHIPVGTYGGHENGSRGFDKDDGAKYAKFYKVAPLWLLYGIGNPRGPDIVEKLITLSPRRRIAAEEHIDI